MATAAASVCAALMVVPTPTARADGTCADDNASPSPDALTLIGKTYEQAATEVRAFYVERYPASADRLTISPDVPGSYPNVDPTQIRVRDWSCRRDDSSYPAVSFAIETKAPDVRGLTADAAEQLLDRRGLSLVVSPVEAPPDWLVRAQSVDPDAVLPWNDEGSDNQPIIAVVLEPLVVPTTPSPPPPTTPTSTPTPTPTPTPTDPGVVIGPSASAVPATSSDPGATTAPATSTDPGTPTAPAATSDPAIAIGSGGSAVGVPSSDPAIAIGPGGATVPGPSTDPTGTTDPRPTTEPIPSTTVPPNALDHPNPRSAGDYGLLRLPVVLPAVALACLGLVFLIVFVRWRRDLVGPWVWPSRRRPRLIADIHRYRPTPQTWLELDGNRPTPTVSLVTRADPGTPKLHRGLS